MTLLYVDESYQMSKMIWGWQKKNRMKVEGDNDWIWTPDTSSFLYAGGLSYAGFRRYLISLLPYNQT